MAPTSLLRYIFRHGPDGRLDGVDRPPRRESQAPTHTSTPSAESDDRSGSPSVSAESEEPESPLAYKDRPNSRASTILEDIAEESGSDDDTSFTEAFAALDLDSNSFTTRDLCTTALNEAKASLHAHLDTLDTSLRLLEALDGFSDTITAMKEEMVAAKETCKKKFRTLEDFERAVKCLRFGDE